MSDKQLNLLLETLARQIETSASTVAEAAQMIRNAQIGNRQKPQRDAHQGLAGFAAATEPYSKNQHKSAGFHELKTGALLERKRKSDTAESLERCAQTAAAPANF